jgi:hypothetical protein
MGTPPRRAQPVEDDASPSTISREVAANGGRAGYRATRAERAAVKRRKRPKVCKLAATPKLRQLVESKLEQTWSPEQIGGWWLKRTYPDDVELQVSHETIYRSLFIPSRGALKRELTGHLLIRRQTRRPGNGNRGRGSGRGRLTNMVHISQRPAEVADRAIPGHWEGDLILGKGMSAIGTLVERSSLVLVHLEGIESEQVVAALRQQVVTLHAQLWRSLTGTRARRWRCTPPSPSTPASRSTSATRRARGSAARTRTPTGCCASTSQALRPQALQPVRPRHPRRRAQRTAPPDPGALDSTWTVARGEESSGSGRRRGGGYEEGVPLTTRPLGMLG